MKRFLIILISIFFAQYTIAQSDTPCGDGGGWGGGGGGNNGAEELTVGSSCSYTNGSIQGGFMSGNTDSGIGDPGCGNYNNGPDVWYQFTVPASGSVLITTQAGQLTDMAMAVYIGSDCNNLTEIACDDNGGTGTMPELDIHGLTPGDVAWIRLWDYGGDETGDFDICIVEETCSDGIWNQGEAGVDCGGPCTECTGDICEHSLPFCTGTTYNFPLQTDNGYAVSGPDYDCLYSQPNPVWYYLQIATAGNIDIHIESTPGQHDVDFICWGPFDHVECDASDLTGSYVVDCSYSTSYSEDCNIPNANVGDYYVLLITNYSNATTNVEFSQTGGTGATDCSIVNPPNCSVELGNDRNACAGDTITLTAVTSVDVGDTYTLTWSPSGTQTGTNTISDVVNSTTTYNVTINTSSGCEATDQVTINVEDLQIDQILTTNDNCGFNLGTATINMANGVSPYFYDIGTDTTSSGTFDSLSIGNYTITVTDNQGCTETGQFTIIDGGSISAGFTSSADQCLSGNSFNFTNTGFTDANATWTWEFQNASPTTNSNLENPTNITWTQAGTFNVSQLVVYGTCRDSVTNQITIYPMPDITSFNNVDNPCYHDCIATSTPVIQSGTAPFTYLWSDAQTTSTATNLCAGDYGLTVTDANGCKDSSNTTITEGTQMSFSNIDYTEPSCHGFNDGVINFDGNGGCQPYTYTLNGNNQLNGNYTNLLQGQYSLSIKDCNSCEIDTSITLNEPEVLEISVEKTDILCYGEHSGTVTMHAQGGTPSYTYHLDSLSNSTGMFNGLYNNTYSVYVTDSHNCKDSSTVEITEPQELILGVTPEYHICNGTSQELETSVSGGIYPYTYHWNTNESSSSITVSPTTETNYWVYIEDANSCKTDTQHIVVIPSRAVEINAYSNKDKVCPGEPIAVTADINYGQAPYSTYVNDEMMNTPIIIYPNNEHIYYYVKVVDACGSTDTDTLKLETYPIPVINFSADVLSGCQPLEVNFNQDIDSIASYSWNFGDEEGSYSANPVHIYNQSGVFDVTLSVITNNGCSAQKTVDNLITVYKKPVSKFIASPEITSFVNPDITFNNISTDAISYIWSFGDGDSSLASNPVHSYDAVGDYMVSLIAISNHNCRDTSAKEIKITEEFTLYVPSAFSPDGDGINEVFKVTGNGIDLDNYHLYVYGRWGELIFETEDLYGAWDGNLKSGKKAPEGTYRWVIYGKDFNGKAFEKTGNITIIR